MYIPGILPRVVIWNETAKQVTLNIGNSWMLEIEVHEVSKKPARISKRRIERDNLYWKRLGSVDEGESIICGLGWMARMRCDI